MNLIMDSTIMELALHTCNFVLKPLHKEGPGARVGSNLRSKSLPKLAISLKNHHIYLPSCITSIPIPERTLVTQLSKSLEKNLAY